MAKFTDYESGKEVQDIMEKFLDKFPHMFEGFDCQRIGFVMTKKKKSRKPIRIKNITYPTDIFLGKTYIVEAFEKWWERMDQKKKNLAVFHIMCAVPDGGFDETAKNYAKVVKPEIEMYLLEFAAAGGVPNWFENPAAKDPLERTNEEIAEDTPTVEAISDKDVAEDDEKDEGDGKSPEVQRKPLTREAVEAVA